jgi:hypothetical protein
MFKQGFRRYLQLGVILPGTVSADFEMYLVKIISLEDTFLCRPCLVYYF